MKSGEEIPVLSAAVQKIPLELLVPSPYNSRRFRTQERIQEIAQSLSAHGQREALCVYPGEGEQQGKYVIVSGVTRLLAAKALGWSTLDAIADPRLNANDPLLLVRMSRVHNDASAETDMDHAAVAEGLAENGCSQDEIMAAMGLNSPRKLFKLRAFGELPQAILDIAARYPEKVSARFAEILKNAVSTLGEGKATLLAGELVAENLSEEKLVRRVRAELRKIANTSVRRVKERATLIHSGSAKVGDLRVMRHPNSDKRKVQLEVHLPEDAARNFFIELENLVQRMKETW